MTKRFAGRVASNRFQFINSADNYPMHEHTEWQAEN